jgi:formylglycine-generating enzyme required for sulfatase activity
VVSRWSRLTPRDGSHLPRERLRAWLDRLSAAGFRVGLRERMLAHVLLVRIAALGGLPAEGSDRLRLLGPLLCSSAEQQADYADLLKVEAAEHQVQRAAPGAQASQDLGSSAPAASWGVSALRWAMLLLVVLVAAAAALFLYGPSGQGTPEPVAAAASAAPAPGLAVERDRAASSPSPLNSALVPRPIYVPPRPLVIDAPAEPGWAGPVYWSLLSIGVVFLALHIWRWQRRRRRRMYLEHVHSSADVEQRLLHDNEPVRVTPPPSLLAPVSRVLRQRTAGEHRVLDVPATIRATILQGGALAPQYRLSQRTPEYLALIERVSSADQQAQFHETLVAALQARGVNVEVFHFKDSPEYGCWRLHKASTAGDTRERHDRASLAELTARFSTHRLLLFGDARAALHPDTGLPLAWLARARHFAQRAWFTPSPVANWGEAEGLVADEAGVDFLLLPLEPAAFATLAEWLSSGRAHLEQHPKAPLYYPPLLKASELAWATRQVQPPPRALEQLMYELRNYLGVERMQWLAACAIFPALSWPLTLALGRKLFEHIDAGSVAERQGDLAIGVAALAALPWFRYGRLPTWLREALLAQLDPAHEPMLRGVIQDKLELAVTQPGAAQIAEIAWLRDAPARLLAWLRQRQGVARDLILVRFLQPSLASRLATQLPDLLRKLLFKDGVSLHGLRLWVECVMALPLLLGLLAVPVVWDTLMRNIGGQPPFDLVDVAVGGKVAQASDLAYSPDGSTFVVAFDDGGMQLHDALSGTVLGVPVKGRATDLRAVVYAPDGLSLLAGSQDGSLTRWSVNPLQPIAPEQFGSYGGPVRALAVSPDGRWSADVQGTQAIVIRALQAPPRSGAAPDKQAGSITAVHVLRLDTSALTMPQLVFSPDSTLLLSAGADRSLRLWDVASGKPVGEPWQGHGAAVIGLAFSADGAQAFSASSDGRLMQWDVASGQGSVLGGVEDGGGELRSFSFAPGAAGWVAGADQLGLRAGTTQGKSRQTWRWPLSATANGARAAPLRALRFHPAGHRLLALAGPEALFAADRNAGELSKQIAATAAVPSQIALIGHDEAQAVRVLGCGVATRAGLDETRVDADTRALAQLLGAAPAGASASAAGAPALAVVAYAARFRGDWGLAPLAARAHEVLYTGAPATPATPAASATSASGASAAQKTAQSAALAQAVVARLQAVQAAAPGEPPWRARAVAQALPGVIVTLCDARQVVNSKRIEPTAWPAIAPDAERSKLVRDLLATLFSAERGRRELALAEAIGKPEFVSDVLPAALARALALTLAQAPVALAAQQSAAPGPALFAPTSPVPQVLALAAQAMPVTLQRNAQAVNDLVDAVSAQAASADAASAKAFSDLQATLQAAAGKRPSVFIHYPSAAALPIANQLKARLEKANFDVPRPRLQAINSPEQTDLRVQQRSDWALARWMAAQVLAPQGATASRIWPLKDVQPGTDSYEIWLGKDLAGGLGQVGDLKVGERFRDCPDDTLCPWLRVLPAGKFTMGSSEKEPGRFSNEGPEHEVTIAKPFAVMEAEVTRGHFVLFAKETGYQAAKDCDWNKPGFDQTDAHPVVCISWNDAQAYAKWLSGKTRQNYRLLSEAEWEYAARASTSSAWWFGSDEARLCEYAKVGSCKSARGTAAGKTYKPNAWGLYDMHGNAWEWVADCWHENYANAPSDGSIWNSGCGKEDRRVLRGGGWNFNPQYSRSAIRINYFSPGSRFNGSGVRLARTLLDPKAAGPLPPTSQSKQ